MVKPSAFRQAVGYLRGEFEMSERRACRVLGVGRSSCGYRRVHVLLRRGGWQINHKRLYRLYRAEGLAVRRRRRKRMALGLRTVLPPPSRCNHRWSMDFTLATLSSGRRFPTLNIVDEFTRECLAIEVDTSIADLGWHAFRLACSKPEADPSSSSATTGRR